MREIKLMLFALVLLFIGSCDDIEEPFVEYQGQCGDASLPVPIRQILVEEFTGHQCGNCPRGDEEMELLKEMYCDHIIPVSIHAGYFANVYASNKYTYDYRTVKGTEIDVYFEASEAGLPNALINRSNDGEKYNPSQWAETLVKLLEEEPVIDIHVEASYNFDNRDLELNIDVVFIKNMDDNLMLSVYFVEDSIKTWQKDYEASPEQDIEFYSHNHVLRDAVNGTWGEQILSGQAYANDVNSRRITYNINQDWVIKNSNIVAFVYKNDTKEVLQATQLHL